MRPTHLATAGRMPTPFFGSLWAWLTCVRFHDKGLVRSYALFIDGNKVVDGRFAVQTDNCDLQTYYPFDRVPTGLNPLH